VNARRPVIGAPPFLCHTPAQSADAELNGKENTATRLLATDAPGDAAVLLAHSTFGKT